MKKILIGLLALGSMSVFAAPIDNCKSTALQLAAAVDKVYIPKLIKGTKISATLISTTSKSHNWNVNYWVPNAGGQTSYEIKLETESCNLQKMSSFSE